MNRKSYRKIRIVIALFIAAIVGVSVEIGSFVLATVAVLTGMIFMIFVRSKAKIRTDERESTIQEKAARMAYAIFAPTIGITAFFLLLPSKSGFFVFRNGEWLFTEALGMILAYFALFLIVVYAISYHFFNRELGGGNNEE